jgi:hypothetical protein
VALIKFLRAARRRDPPAGGAEAAVDLALLRALLRAEPENVLAFLQVHTLTLICMSIAYISIYGVYVRTCQLPLISHVELRGTTAICCSLDQ